MDRGLRDQKLESLRRCVARLAEKRPGSLEVLRDNYDLQDIIVVNLERAVQVCVDLAASLAADLETKVPDTMGQSFDILHHHGILSAPTAERMKKAVGFRNIAVHAYRQIDWQIVYSILHERLSDFETFAREIVKATNGFPADERK